MSSPPAAPPPAALVTGAARRLGRAIAVELARRGFDVAVHYNSSAADAAEVVDEIAALGRRAVALAADLSAADGPTTLLAAARAAFPDLSLLVNNASLFEAGSLLETTPELFDRNLAVHVRAPFFLIRDFARHLGVSPAPAEPGAATEAKGQVINLLDTRVSRDVVDHFAYTLSKKSLADLTRLAARALAPTVRVNAVAPGVILPPPGAVEGYLERRAASVPLRRVGTVAAIVAAVGYLLDNPFVTGQTLWVDGGEHLL